MKKKLRIKKPRVGVLHLRGIIGGSKIGGQGLNLHNVNHKIEKAFSLKNLKAVAIVINSPGGSPVQTDLIASRIRQLAEEKSIFVFTFIEDIAASGGYWLACAGDEVYASSSSIIGSIGVIASGFGLEEAIGKLGIKRRIYTKGKYKSILDPFEPERPQDLEIIQEIQEDVYNHFIQKVKKMRGEKLKLTEEIFNGKVWSGEKALKLGLIDGIGHLHEVMTEKYGKKVELFQIEAEKSWFKKILGIDYNVVGEVTEQILLSIEQKLKLNKYNYFK